jgi:hypothetical protein
MIEYRFKIGMQIIRHVLFVRFLMLWAGLVFLAGCVVPPEPVRFDDSFQVSSVSVRFFQKGERRVPLEFIEAEDRRFPRSDIGLSRSKVQADLKRALERSMIPASRGGTREVRVQLTIYRLSLRAGGVYGYDAPTALVGWLDFVDAQSGEVLVADIKFYVNPMTSLSLREVMALKNTPANVVREYNTLVTFVAAAGPKYLP